MQNCTAKGSKPETVCVNRFLVFVFEALTLLEGSGLGVDQIDQVTSAVVGGAKAGQAPLRCVCVCVCVCARARVCVYKVQPSKNFASLFLEIIISALY